jgi:hypothetical protein
MYFEPFWERNAVNTGVPCPKVPMHRKLGYEQQSEEVLYIGDQRMAVVTWGGRAFVCDDVDSAEHAFEHIVRDMEG